MYYYILKIIKHVQKFLDLFYNESNINNYNFLKIILIYSILNLFFVYFLLQ